MEKEPMDTVSTVRTEADKTLRDVILVASVLYVGAVAAIMAGIGPVVAIIVGALLAWMPFRSASGMQKAVILAGAAVALTIGLIEAQALVLVAVAAGIVLVMKHQETVRGLFHKAAAEAKDEQA